LSSANTYPIGVRNKSPGRESGAAIIRETLRVDAAPFHPVRPSVGMKTVPVVNLDKSSQEAALLPLARMSLWQSAAPVSLVMV
jgi:hypothetical protein